MNINFSLIISKLRMCTWVLQEIHFKTTTTKKNDLIPFFVGVIQNSRECSFRKIYLIIVPKNNIHQ